MGLTEQFNNGIEYIKNQMSPQMKQLYGDVDYKKTLEMMSNIEKILVSGQPVLKSDVDLVVHRLDMLIEVEQWGLEPPKDDNLDRIIKKLNPMRRMLQNAYNHTTEIRTMILDDVKEKFILNNSDGSDETLPKSFYTLKEEHRFIE